MKIYLTEEFHGCLSYRWGSMRSCELGVVDCLFERGSGDSEFFDHLGKEDAGLGEVAGSFGG
jgi:hypothetical protein